MGNICTTTIDIYGKDAKKFSDKVDEWIANGYDGGPGTYGKPWLGNIAKGRYIIAPPRMQLIPKDNGKFRTVYINEDLDRIILSMINDILFDLCPDWISLMVGRKSCSIG